MQPGVIKADELYTFPEFKKRTGLGQAAIREAKKRGLVVRQIGRNKYVLGADIIEFVRDVAKVG